MARAARSESATLESCLAEVEAGKPAPVYLFDGDAFLAGRAARQVAEAWIPEPQRSLNLVELDAAASPGEVAAELATRGLFGGNKCVVVHDPAFLTSKEDVADAFERARDMWAAGRQREAARRLLAIAAKAGWTARELDPAGGEAPDAEAWQKELGVTLGDADRDFVAGAARYALERDMKAAKDDAAPLEALLAGGLPPGHVLVVAAKKIDGRLPLGKKLASLGRRAAVGVQKEGQWGEERVVLGPVLEGLLEGTGKSVDRAAQARLAELVGDDARTLASEVQKLVAYAGDRETITRDDVDQMVTRVAQDPFFALGNAVEARELGQALGVLDRSLADGASIYMVVGSLAATVRRLIVERERGRVAAKGRRIASFNDWSAAVLPSISEEELGNKKPYGFWMKYQAALRFSREELLDGLAELAEADHAMKTGGDGRVLVERALIRLLGGNK